MAGEAAYTLKIRSGCAGGGKGALVQTEKTGTLSTLQDQTLFQPIVFDARGNGNGKTVPTITGDHESRVTDYGFEYMRNIRDGSLEMRIFKGRFGERVTLPVREVVEHETSGTGHKLIFDTYFALKDQYERDEVWM